MKPFYVVVLMGAAAVGGGLVVRYSEHPVEITLARPVIPPVVAPPIPPKAHVGPSTSVPVHSAPVEAGVSGAADAEPAPKPPEKPSAFSVPVHVAKLEPVDEPAPPEPRPTARVRIPPEPPAVIPLRRTSTSNEPEKIATAPPPVTLSLPPAGVSRTPDPPPPAVAKPAPAPPQSARVQPAPYEPNHATLKAGMLITVRIGQALSSNTNSPGDVFSGTLDRPLIADGFVIAERGAPVRGEVMDSKTAGRGSELTIRLREIVASDGQRVHIVSDPWKKVSAGDARANTVYDVPLTRGGAAVIRPATSITFRLDEAVDLTEKR